MQANALPDHPRRCQGQSRRARRRCFQWAVKGRKYCKFHGGAKKAVFKRMLGVRYSKNLGPKLKAFVESQLSEGSAAKQLELYEELAIQRAMVSDALFLCKGVFEDPEKVDANTRALAHGVLNDMLENVAKMVETITRVEKNARETFDARHLDGIILQMLRIIKSVLEPAGQGALVEKISERMDEALRLPHDVSGVKGKVEEMTIVAG